MVPMMLKLYLQGKITDECSVGKSVLHYIHSNLRKYFYQPPVRFQTPIRLCQARIKNRLSLRIEPNNYEIQTNKSETDPLCAVGRGDTVPDEAPLSTIHSTETDNTVLPTADVYNTALMLAR
ncbi:hypothetical protein J6590_018008 [Homalodisca vitripennis]|nr:hypothetical protein J6590_059473 [Homalodisca vitripennis]KAG8327569.1 hypothetical protein J6590_018008 [Homalodisca vitripennis]